MRPFLIVQHLFKYNCMHIIFYSNSQFLLEENNIHVIPYTWVEFSHVKGEQRKLDFVIVLHGYYIKRKHFQFDLKPFHFSLFLPL